MNSFAIKVLVKKRLIIAIFSLLLLFSGCGKSITEGEVIEKNFTPEYTSHMLMPLVISDGKSCSTILVPYTYYYADKWTITIRNYSDEGDELTETFRVTEDVYNSVEIGSEFVYKEDFEPSTPEYKRERE